MFGSIGGLEILVILAIGLLVFGPRKMPEIARTLGRTLNEFRRTAMEVRTSIERELDVEEVKKATRSVTQAIQPDSLLKELDPRAVEGKPRDTRPARPTPQRDEKDIGDDTAE